MPNRFEALLYNVLLIIVAISAIYALPLSKFFITTFAPATMLESINASEQPF